MGRAGNRVRRQRNIIVWYNLSAFVDRSITCSIIRELSRNCLIKLKTVYVRFLKRILSLICIDNAANISRFENIEHLKLTCKSWQYKN